MADQPTKTKDPKTTIEKAVLSKALIEFDDKTNQLFMLIEKEIDDKCLKMSTFALFGFRIKLTEEINKIKKLTE